MRTGTLSALLLGLAAACAPRPAPTAGIAAGACRPEPPAGAGPLTPERAPWLAGRFRLITVTTSQGRAYRHAAETGLTLRMADSLERAAATARGVGHAPRRALQFVGRWRWAPDSEAQQPDLAEVDAGVLYLGCRDCLDGSPWHLQITAVSPAGFWGTWRDYQTGTVRAVDGRGRELPDPAGFFCAVREAGSG